jgi:hypothetical protein
MIKGTSTNLLEGIQVELRLLSEEIFAEEFRG